MMLNVKGRQAYYSGPEHHEAGHFVEERTSASVLMQHKTEKASQRGDKCADSSSLGARRSAEPYYAKKTSSSTIQEAPLFFQVTFFQKVRKGRCFGPLKHSGHC